MASRRKTLPPVSPKVDPQVRALLSAMSEVMETGEGVRGNPLDRKLTVRDLIDSGIGKFPPGSRGGGTIIPGDNIPVPNLSTPPAPTGFEASGGIGYIFLSWDQPRLAYANHGYTEIWRHTEDNLANAVLYAQVTGSMFGDLDTLLGTTYYYWVRFISDSSVAGPFNNSSGTSAAESENPQELLDRLNGEITELQLFSDLNARIDLIDGPPELAGSVAQRLFDQRGDLENLIDLEETARIQAIQDEAAARTQAVQDEANARQAAVSLAYTELEQYADSESAAAVDLGQLVAVFGGNIAGALNYTISEVDSDLAITTTFSSIQAQFSGVDGDLASKAEVTYVDQAIADEEQARALAISTLDADLQGQIDSKASITYVNDAVANADYASASEFSSLVAQFGGNIANALSYTVAEVDDNLAVTTTFNQIDNRFQSVEGDIATKANITYVDQAISDEESARASQFNQLSANIDSSIFGRNLTFEAGNTGWNSSGNWSIVNDPANARRGNWVARFDGTTQTQNDNTLRFPAAPGEKFIGSCWINSSSATGGLAYVNIRWERQDGSLAGKSSGSTVVDGLSGWNHSRVYGEAPVDAARGHISVIVTDDGGQAPSGVWYVDDFTIAPAPKDDDLGVVPATVSASVTEVNEAVANASGASASSIAQLSTQHGTNTSTIQVQQDSIDGLEASYTVKIDVNGQVAGYGLSVTGNQYNDSVDSIMLFSVDTFAIGSPGANELSFIVENGQVVMDAAFIVNLVVTDADIVSVTVGKITGLTASFIEAKIENLSVDKISGDVNTTIEAPVVSGLNLPNVSGEAYREAVTLSIPSQTRPRIPLLFSKAVHSSSSTGDYLTKYKVLEYTGVGPSTDLDEPYLMDEGYMRWEKITLSSSPEPDPAGWDQISTGSEIGRYINGVWHYYSVSHKNYSITNIQDDEYEHFWEVWLDWGVSRGEWQDVTNASSWSFYRVRNGSDRLYTSVVSEGQNIAYLTANDETEVNSYVLSLPRSSSSQEYVFAVYGDGTLEELQFTALLVR